MSTKLREKLTGAVPFFENSSTEHDYPSQTVYQTVPHDGDVKGVYHAHSRHSDGLDDFDRMLKGAARLRLDYYGFMDHLDLTGISNQVHQGPWMGYFSENMEYRKTGIEDYIEDTSADIAEDEGVSLEVGRGAEIDWDPRNIDKLVDASSSLDMDYRGVSVHYFGDGKSVKDPSVIQDSTIEERVGEYLNETVSAIEAAPDALFDVICHPGRPEEGVLEPGFAAEDYYPILDAAKEEGVVYEINPKVHLRYLLDKDVIPPQLETSEDYLAQLPSEFEALATYPDELPEVSIGTDTHRVGHSKTHRNHYIAMRDLEFSGFDNSHLTETQMRLKFAEDILNQLSQIRGQPVQPTSILENKDTSTLTFRNEDLN